MFFSLIFVFFFLVGAGVCVSKKELLWNAVGLLLCGFAGGGDCGFDVVEVVSASSGICTICSVFFVFFRFDSLSEVSLCSSLFGGLVQVFSFRGARHLSRVLLSSLPASVHLVFVCDSVSLPQPHHHRENSNCFPLLLILLSEETSIFDLIVSEKIRLFFPLLIPSVCTASRKEGTSRLGRER